jgi:hypothetical protein
MSGWQRIGVVISLLWLIGSPIYFLVSEYREIEAKFEACIARSTNAGDALIASAACNLVRNIDRDNASTLPSMLKILTFRDKSLDPGVSAWLGGLLWFMWLGRLPCSGSSAAP